MKQSQVLTAHGPLVMHWRADADHPIIGLDLAMKPLQHADQATGQLADLLNILQDSSRNTECDWALQLCDWSGTTSFRRRALETLFATTPAGRVVSYGELAQRLDPPSAARAVGGAMRRNPFPVLIPCHRCVASNGLGGFMGQVPGSAERKQLLLRSEGLTL